MEFQSKVEQSSSDLKLRAADSPDGLSRHENGRAIYNFRCYFCHGYSGDAKTLATSYLTPRPRNFITTSTDDLSREAMLVAVTLGRPGTAMNSFKNTLTTEEIALVVDFVRNEFIINKARNTSYHTIENGWPNHERYAIAFPFALGQIPVDKPWEALNAEQRQGKRLFMQSCITCHDRAKVEDEGVIWELRPVSYPRNQYSHKKTPNLGSQVLPGRAAALLDADTAASPYARHDKAPFVKNLTVSEAQGQRLFQQNCAFCHAADGTGKNWIGSFLASHPRDLTDTGFMRGMTREKLKKVIENGVPGTTMSAWKNVLTEQQIESIIDYVSKAFYELAGFDNDFFGDN
ncbi:MAG: cytochrome c [Gammaproteobacteria bacterium]|nr:cytochrome c [Gammaproteobacteria bacterium]